MMKTDIQIAQEAELMHIKDVAASIGISEEELEFYGKYKAKLSDELWENVKDRKDGKLVLVTAIEAICKDTKYLTEAEFYQLMDELLHDPACKFCDVVHEMVRGRVEAAEAKERKFAEEEALLKAMQRGELPQGDE